MAYIQPLTRQQVDAATGATLDAVQAKLGVLPNMFRTFAHSPVALNAYMQLSGLTASGRLNARQREQIALAVGEANDCGYCVAAHSVIGKGAGLTPAQIELAREAQAEQPRDAALLRLASAIVRDRGHVPTAELDAFKTAGFDDGDILEVLVSVMLNVFTNYTNHLARTDLDFPAAVKRAA
ncbi:carboxymuconolactone decarboxylase family protein [Arenimonas sp.]|uniref:carboxymuconolactone decarboxylase family protein n=1 Tax=Arenimonas sp. TaxID=1872635 RepID=UPI0039E6C972